MVVMGGMRKPYKDQAELRRDDAGLRCDLIRERLKDGDAAVRESDFAV